METCRGLDVIEIELSVRVVSRVAYFRQSVSKLDKSKPEGDSGENSYGIINVQR